MTARFAVSLLLTISLAVLWALSAAPACAQAAPPLSQLADPQLLVAGRAVTLTQRQVEVKQNTLVIPLRPVAEALLADMEIDPASQTIRVTRADDRVTLVYDVRDPAKTFGGVVPRGAELVDLTPGREALPQRIMERLFNVYITIDTSKNQVLISPINLNFANELAGFVEEEQHKKRHLPVIRLNAVSNNVMLNENNVSALGETSTFSANAQVGRTFILPYATYVGSKNGPGFRYSMGGVTLVRPGLGRLQIGDYGMYTGSQFTNGIFRGLLAERTWGDNTKIGLGAGRIQNSAADVGIQQQRPLFRRNAALAYFVADSSDFNFKSSFWKNHRLVVGGGGGLFRDFKNLQAHPQGLLSYLYARDTFTRLNGNWKSTTDATIGGSQATNLLPNGQQSAFHGGNVFLFRQSTTLFKRITIGTLVQRGSPNWSTLDPSNAYRNTFNYVQSLNVRAIRGVTLFAERNVTHPTRRGPKQEIKTYTFGGAFDRYPLYLPIVSYSTSITPIKDQPTQFFNTLLAYHNVRPLRTVINGQWLQSRTTGQEKFSNNVSLATSTTLYRGIRATFSRFWASQEITNTLVGVNSGNLLGSWLSGGFSIGRQVQGDLVTPLFNANLAVYIPYLNERANVTFNRTGENFQVIVTMTGTMSRRRRGLPATLEGAAGAATGSLAGRFYVDTDLSGTFTPGVDKPLAGLRVIVNGNVLATSNEQGEYSIRGLGKGFVSVTTDLTSIPATLAFLNETTQGTFILPRKTKTLDFRFGPHSQVSGSVRIVGEGKPPLYALQDIRVYIVGTDRDSLTDEDGDFRVADIPPGKYILKVDPDYVHPQLEIVKGEASVDLKPGMKLKGIVFDVRLKEPEVEKKRF